MNDDSPSHTPRSRNPLGLARDRGWVSLRDFCKIADITYQTGLRWCKLEMISFIQVGGVKRIYEEEIARFIQFGTLKPNEEKRRHEITKREEYKQNAIDQRRKDSKY